MNSLLLRASTASFAGNFKGDVSNRGSLSFSKLNGMANAAAGSDSQLNSAFSRFSSGSAMHPFPSGEGFVTLPTPMVGLDFGLQRDDSIAVAPEKSIDKDDHLRNDSPTDDTKQLWLREDARLILQILECSAQSPLHRISKAVFLLLTEEGGVKLAEGIITEETEEVETEGVTMEEQNRNQRAQNTTVTVAATSSSSSKKTVTISVDEYAKLSQRQESVKQTSLVAAFAESDQCLVHDLMTKQTIGKERNYKNQHGILHQSSCADTPAQNGVAERKNRHLLETIGYRCHSPDLHRYLVSTDVVFSEYSPFFSSKSDSRSEGEDDDWLMYEIFRLVPIEPTISEDRTLEDGLSIIVSILVEASNATDGASSGVVQSEDVDCLGEQATVPSTPVKPPIVQVYSRRREHHHTCPAPNPSSSDPPPNDLDLPIGLRKVFYRKSTAGVILLVYVDDIVITRDDCTGITSLKKFLQTKFHTKDLGQLKYFLGIEVTRTKKGIFLSQRKDGQGRSQAVQHTNEPSVHLTKDDGGRLDDPKKYRRLVGKLNYLTVTHPDIAYAVSIVSQFMSEPTVKYLAALKQILCYL
ncbi:hypothetical protein RJ639_046733 [Escallonia herrerae]|uniref:Reverse transcriptase Ty1/copia-type domain-containing protein n=1 Tax=Escallonia herrerae TaxID=1293975 RepID=A0AA89B0L5_9ASTE|nr:hypothetical protein RJ639_046733 [Escallonia herrerae]